MKQTTLHTKSRGFALPFLGGPAYLTRTVWVAGLTGVVVAVTVAAKWGPYAGVGFTGGLAWGLANFLVLAGLLRALTTPGKPDQARAARFLLLKMGLYALGIVALWKQWLPPLAMVGGFSWLFVVVLLRAAGAMLVGDRSPKTAVRTGTGSV